MFLPLRLRGALGWAVFDGRKYRRSENSRHLNLERAGGLSSPDQSTQKGSFVDEHQACPLFFRGVQVGRISAPYHASLPRQCRAAKLRYSASMQYELPSASSAKPHGMAPVFTCWEAILLPALVCSHAPGARASSLLSAVGFGFRLRSQRRRQALCLLGVVPGRMASVPLSGVPLRFF